MTRRYCFAWERSAESMRIWSTTINRPPNCWWTFRWDARSFSASWDCTEQYHRSPEVVIAATAIIPIPQSPHRTASRPGKLTIFMKPDGYRYNVKYFYSLAGPKWCTTSSACTRRCGVTLSLGWTSCLNYKMRITYWRPRSSSRSLCSHSDHVPVSGTGKWSSCVDCSIQLLLTPQPEITAAAPLKWTFSETSRKLLVNIYRTRAKHFRWTISPDWYLSR